MRKERTTLPVSAIAENRGQLPWMRRNPRQWTKDDVRRTAASIREDPDFLEERPLCVVPHGDGYIVFAGNLRLNGAREAGLDTVPAVVHYPATDADRETVLRRAMKDNGSFGSWDFDTLANEWDDLPLTDWGVPAWEGHEEATDSAAAPTVMEDDDFDQDDKGILVRCKPGDIWELGEHRLACGDSTDLETVKKLMGGVLADMVFTDPPYGVAVGSKNAMLNTVQPSGRCCKDIANDTLPVDELYEVLRAAFENAKEVCAPDACYFVCSPPGGEFGQMMMMMMEDAGLKVRHQIVWRKNAPTFSLGRLDYDYQHESILYTWTEKHHNYRGGKYRSSVWDFDKPRKCDLHPTMKPVELVANAILDGTREGDVVLDIFGGSGTTAIAAEQLGRKARLVEIDPHYCDVIISRWEQFTGKEARRYE